MGLPDLILSKLRLLPLRADDGEKQIEVIDFTEFLRLQSAQAAPLRPVKGMLADLNASVSAADFGEVRREMWGELPREIHS